MQIGAWKLNVNGHHNGHQDHRFGDSLWWPKCPEDEVGELCIGAPIAEPMSCRSAMPNTGMPAFGATRTCSASTFSIVARRTRSGSLAPVSKANIFLLQKRKHSITMSYMFLRARRAYGLASRWHEDPLRKVHGGCLSLHTVVV
jgi:hypothetical protein